MQIFLKRKSLSTMDTSTVRFTERVTRMVKETGNFTSYGRWPEKQQQQNPEK